MSLAKRATDFLHRLFYSKKRSVSLSSRFIAIGVVMLTVATVFPTLAEESSSTPEQVEVEVLVSEPTTEPSPTPSPEVSESAQPAPIESVAPTPAPSSTTDESERSPSPSPSESAEEEVIEAAKLQPRINFRVPASLAVDPRAWVGNLPQLSLTGGSLGMLCLSSNAIIDIATKNMSNDFKGDESVVIGDATNFVRIVGSMGFINAMINTENGIRLLANRSGISGSGLALSYVELTGVDASPEFCGQSANRRSITFRPLGLQLDTVKAPVDMGKPSGR